MLRVDAADRADVARDERGRLVARAACHDDVARRAVEGAVEIRRAAGHVHGAGAAGGARRCLPRLRDRLVRHAARVDDLDLRLARDLDMTVREQALTDRLGVGERDLASEESRGERRHGRLKSLDAHRRGSAVAALRKRSAAQPSSSTVSTCVQPGWAGRSPAR